MGSISYSACKITINSLYYKIFFSLISQPLPIPDPSPSGRAQLRSADLNFSGKGNEACAPTGLPLRTTQQSCDHFAGKACPCGRKPFITGCYTSPKFPPRFLHGSTSNPWRKEGKRKGIRRGLEEGKKKRQRKAIALQTLQTLQQKTPTHTTSQEEKVCKKTL